MKGGLSVLSWWGERRSHVFGRMSAPSEECRRWSRSLDTSVDAARCYGEGGAIVVDELTTRRDLLLSWYIKPGILALGTVSEAVRVDVSPGSDSKRSVEA
tara:strand:+ start:268 stop:567 length:300 start_codon:yes stop_codon:yes gene_type:complete